MTAWCLIVGYAAVVAACTSTASGGTAAAAPTVSVQVARGWARYQSAHIILYAPSGQDVRGLIDELERAHRDVRAFGLALPGMVEARCYGSTAAFVQGSGGSAYNLALARARRLYLQPLAVLTRHGEMARALRHELTHVALDAPARLGLPRWLNEGLAMAAAAEKLPERIGFRSLAQLDDTIARSRSYDNVRSAYGTAERITTQLLARCGRSKVLALVRSVGAGAGFDRAFTTLVGQSPALWGAVALKR